MEITLVIFFFLIGVFVMILGSLSVLEKRGRLISSVMLASAGMYSLFYWAEPGLGLICLYLAGLMLALKTKKGGLIWKR